MLDPSRPTGAGERSVPRSETTIYRRYTITKKISSPRGNAAVVHAPYARFSGHPVVTYRLPTAALQGGLSRLSVVWPIVAS